MVKHFPRLVVPSNHRGEPWSRTQGGMGGTQIWRRWSACSMAVVGVGRSGSLVAEALLRSGVKTLALIDPDAVELHNIAEMALLTKADLGKPKVAALAARLHGLSLPCHIETVMYDITKPTARHAAAACELLWQCVDNDAARLAGSLVASAYHRVLIDVATGIHFDRHTRRLGADIRLILPGDGCLLCWGGVNQLQEGVEQLLSGSGMAADADFRRQRAGSLRSLNQTAVGLALRLAEDLLAGSVERSVWLRLEFDAHGLPKIDTLPPTRLSDCPLCTRSGGGDALFLP